MMLILIMLGIVAVSHSEGWYAGFYFLPFYAFFVGYFLLLFWHNHKNPQHKIKIFTVIPYELREEDEGLQYFTFKAVRKVYIFYYFAIPCGILFIGLK